MDGRVEKKYLNQFSRGCANFVVYGLGGMVGIFIEWCLGWFIYMTPGFKWLIILLLGWLIGYLFDLIVIKDKYNIKYWSKAALLMSLLIFYYAFDVYPRRSEEGKTK